MRHLLLGGGLAFAGLFAGLNGTGCGTPVTCGPGTRLDAESQQCRPIQSPDLNVIVDDFNIGEFAFTNTDVPEQMQPGFPDDRTFTITNTGEEDQTVTFIRVSLVPVEENIDELKDAIADIGSEPDCETDADCSASTFCEPNELICKLNPTVIGAVIIENLAAGETRDISYQLALPSGFEQNGVYGLMFSVNEVVLVKDEATGEFFEDPEHPLGIEDPFARAAAVFAPATMLVGIPDKPNLRILFADTNPDANNEESTAAFEVSETETPVMIVSARLSAQGKSVVAPVHNRFELRLPGHVVELAGQDLGEEYFTARNLDFNAAPATTTFVYDAGRVFALRIATGADEYDDEVVFQPQCTTEECACVDEDCTQTTGERLTVQNDLGRDGSFELHLSAEDRRLLAMTTSLRNVNTALTQDDEIIGTVKMIVSTDEPEYEVGGNQLLSDNEIELPVVFMAPPLAGAADPATDSEWPPPGEAEQAVGPFNPIGADADYGEVDNLSPTWNWSIGNEWVGAEAQILNRTSKNRFKSALVAQKIRSSNYARLNAIKNTFDIVNLSASIDWGSKRDIKANYASGRLTLMGINYLDINFVAPFPQCATEDNFQTCMILAGEYRPRKNEGTPAKTKRAKKKFYLNYERGKSFYFAVGPLPFTVEIGVSAGLGMRGTVALVQDTSTNDENGTAELTGMQVTVGPVADAGGSVFGGLTLGLLRAGVRGSVTFASVEFQPAVTVGQSMEATETVPAGGNAADYPCWRVNTGQVVFEAPLTVTVLSGDIKVVVEGGICGCLPWLGCACAWGEVFSFTIVTIPPAWSSTWNLYGNTWDFNGGPGICPGVPVASTTWNSPKGCTDWAGAQSYCNGANGSGAYTTTFTRASGCGQLVINGQTESSFDFVTVRDSAGNQIIRESGNFSNRTINYCAPSASVTLTTDGSVVYSGVSVRSQ